MKLKKVKQAETKEYPSYDGYKTDRRRFLENMVAGASAFVAGAVLAGCQETQPAGVVAVTKGKIRPPKGGGSVRTGGVPKPATPPGEPPAPVPPSKETTTWMGVNEKKKPGEMPAPTKPPVLRGRIKSPRPKKPKLTEEPISLPGVVPAVQLKGDIPCPKTGK